MLLSHKAWILCCKFTWSRKPSSSEFVTSKLYPKGRSQTSVCQLWIAKHFICYFCCGFGFENVYLHYCQESLFPWRPKMDSLHCWPIMAWVIAGRETPLCDSDKMLGAMRPQDLRLMMEVRKEWRRWTSWSWRRWKRREWAAVTAAQMVYVM